MTTTAGTFQTDVPSSRSEKWTRWHTFGLFGTLVAIALFGFLIPLQQILLTWLLILGALVLFAIVAGHGITGERPFGWLIDEQYTMSLSRLQMFLWTVVVLSAFLTAAIINIRKGYADVAVAIAIPEQVWLAMGIGTISLVSSPLILSVKKKETPTPEAMEQMEKVVVQRKLLSSTDSETDKNLVLKKHSIGKIYRNQCPEDARLSDLVRGEEIVNADVLDLSRLQNLFFTLILVGAYAAALGSYLVSQSVTKLPLHEFPALADSSIALLAISHAGYLTSKAISKQ